MAISILQLPPDVLRHLVFSQEILDRCTIVLARFVCRYFRAVIPLLERGAPWGADICVLAARSGNLKALQWARAHGARWDARVCTAAARGGHLHLLQWARAHGARWTHMCGTAAAAGGHLEVLEWAANSGAPVDDFEVVRAAVRNSRVALLRGLFKLWPLATEWYDDNALELLYAALQASDPRVLPLVRNIAGSIFNYTALKMAVFHGRLDALELVSVGWNAYFRCMRSCAFGKKAEAVRQWLQAHETHSDS
jgi:hypothetical protein